VGELDAVICVDYRWRMLSIKFSTLLLDGNPGVAQHHANGRLRGCAPCDRDCSSERRFARSLLPWCEYVKAQLVGECFITFKCKRSDRLALWQNTIIHL